MSRHGGGFFVAGGGGGGTGGAGSVTLGMSNLGNSSGTTGVVQGSDVALYLAGGNNVTLSQSINGGAATVTISAFNQSVQTQMTGLTAGLSNAGNTAGTSGLVSNRFVFVGSDNITLSQSVNGESATLSIYGAAAGTGGGVVSLNGSSGQLTLSAGNLMSVSNNASTINLINVLSSSAIAQPVSSASNAGTLSSRFALADHAHAGINSVSVAGNTAGATSAGAGSLVLAGGNNVTLSGATAAGGMTLSVVGGAGGGGATLSRWNNAGPSGDASAFTVLGLGSVIGSMLLFPLHPLSPTFPAAMTPSTVLMNFTGNPIGSSSFTNTTTFGVYTVENSTRLNLLYQATTSFGLTSATNQSTGMRGPRFLSFHSSQFSDSASQATTPAFSPASSYIGAVLFATSNQTKAQSMYGKYIANAQRSGTYGTSLVTNATMAWDPVAGIYATAAIPQAVSITSISGGTDGAGFVPNVIFENIFTAY